MNIIKRFMSWAGGGIGYTGGNYYANRNIISTAAGPAITEDTALTIPAFFHALRLFGQTIGSLPWDLVKIEDRGRSISREHPVHRLLHDSPNDMQLPSAWRETMVGQAICYGASYSYIERNGNFRPTALLPLLPDRTYPTRVNGELKYTTMVNGIAQTLEPYEVFVLNGFSMNGISGVPLVRLMRESLGLTKAEEAYASAYFGNGGNYGGVVTVPGKLDDAAMKNLRDGFTQNNSGLGNAFRWMFLEEGMKAERSDVDAEKTQLIQSRGFQLSELCRIVGLAPHLIYDLSRSTNNNIEYQGIESTIYSWKPWSNKLCQEANRKLLYESEMGIYEATIDLKPLSKGSAKEQAERNQILFNTCSITPNEIRAEDGRNPIDGGDQLYINVATQPLTLVIQKIIADIEAAKAAAGDTDDNAQLEAEEEAAYTEGQDTQPAEPNDNPPPQGNKLYDDGPAGVAAEEENYNAIDIPRALQPMVADIIQRTMRREAKAVRSGLAKTSGDQEAYAKWLDTHAAETRSHVAEILQPIAASFAQLGQPLDVDALATAFTTRTATDLETLAKASPLDRAEELNMMLHGWTSSRAETLTAQLIEGPNEDRT